MEQTLIRINEVIKTTIRNYEIEFRHDQNQFSQTIIQFLGAQLSIYKLKFEHMENISISDEIFYFKYVKCHLLALIQYYSMVQSIEMDKPPIEKSKIKSYYLKKLYRVKSVLKKNKQIYTYFKTDDCQYDEFFFKRNNQDLFVMGSNFVIDIDKRSNTPVSHLYAQMEAYDMLRSYLKQKIANFSEQIKPKSSLKWTLSKTDLIELIYALHATGSFNNGKADLKEIADSFQDIFQIDLGQFNRVFFDIRSRKINKTKFLDQLRDNLINRIKSTENELFI